MIQKILTAFDTEKIVSLESKSFSDGWKESQIISAFNTGRFFAYGIFEDERLVSFISYSVSVDSADIESVCTDCDCRKRGYANKLLENVISDLKDRSVKKIFLEVRKSNTPAISLYMKNGFNKISERKKYYFDGEDALIYCKEI